MPIADDAVEVRARGWRTLAALHGRLEEYTVLDTLARQDGWHMRMQQLARAAALSHSATTRLVNRLENRGLLSRYLCADDRRGIYSQITEQGRELLERARPVHDATLKEALDAAGSVPELGRLVELFRV
jgi:DNA-binding MarR family transcriptional regulator